MHFSHSLRYIFPCYLPNGMARWADSSTTKAANDQQELVLDVEVLHAHEGDVNGVLGKRILLPLLRLSLCSLQLVTTGW